MSGTVNTDIYAGLRPQAAEQQPLPSPLTMLSGLQQIQHTGLENQQLGQTIAARQGIGEAYQQATNPDGSLDEQKLYSAVAADPRTAYMAQQFQAAQQAINLSKAQLTSTQIGNAHDTMQFFTQNLGSLYNDPKLTTSKLWDVASQFLSHQNSGMGGMDLLGPAQVVDFMKGIPMDAPPEVLRQKVGGLMAQFKPTQDALGMLLPKPQVLGSGANAPVTDANPLSAGQPYAASAAPGMPGSVVHSDASPDVKVNNFPNGFDARGNPVATTGAARVSGLMPQAGTVTPPGGPQGPPQGGYGALFGPTPGAPAPSAGSAPNPLLAPPGATAPAPDPKVYNPGTPPSLASGPDASGTFRSGYAPGAEALQVKSAADFQGKREALSETLGNETEMLQSYKNISAALQSFNAGPGKEGLAGLARSVIAAASNWGPDAKPLVDKANSWLQTADDPNKSVTPQDALAASQFINTTLNQVAAQRLKAGFGNTGTQGEFEKLSDANAELRNEKGATFATMNMLQQARDYHNLQNQAAQTYADAYGGQANWPGFIAGQNGGTGWQDYAAAHGFGSLPTSKGSVVQPQADTSGMAAGLKPQAQAAAIPPMPAGAPLGTKWLPSQKGYFKPNPVTKQWEEVLPNG